MLKIGRDGCPPDSGSHYRLCFALKFVGARTDDSLIRDGIDGNSLLRQAKEELTPTPGAATVEPNSELIQIVIQILMADRSLVSSDQPTFKQGDHSVNARQQLRRSFLFAGSSYIGTNPGGHSGLEQSGAEVCMDDSWTAGVLLGQQSRVRAVLQQFYEQKGLTLHSWNSRGRVNITPASPHRTAHSSRLRYWSNLTIFPSHSVPDEVVITTTFGTSQGPAQPLMVNWTRFSSPRFRHSLFSHSTGTSGSPRSTLPQQQPRQIVICPTTRRLVFSGQSLSSFTVLHPFFLLKPLNPICRRVRLHQTVPEICQTTKRKRQSKFPR